MTLTPRHVQWSHRYQAKLAEYIRQPRVAGMAPALALGRQAVDLGLETLDVAGIHEQVMLSIAGKEGPPKATSLARAKRFFLETIVPIEQTHLAALETERRVKTATEALRLRTAESSTAARRLERGIARRKAAETVLQASGTELTNVLSASHDLNRRLQRSTRDTMVTHEGVRRYAGDQLRNEIAQTLLAIHLRLLTLKLSTTTSMNRLQKEIAANQALVKQSVKTIQRLAHEIDQHHEA